MGNSGQSPIPQWTPNKPKLLDEQVGHYLDKSDPETEVFHISFKYYNDKECEIAGLIKNRAIAALINLKIIGRCYDFKSLKDNGINIIKVRPSGDYQKLFTKRITEDVELREHKIQSDARLFYFIAEKMFYIVAITNSHYETDKNRR